MADASNHILIDPQNLVQSIEVSNRVARLIAQITENQHELKNAITVLPKLEAIVIAQTEALKNAGIDLSVANSPLEVKLDGIGKDNTLWKTESTQLIEAQKRANSQFWSVLIVLLVSLGLNLFNLIDYKISKHGLKEEMHNSKSYHYDSNKNAFFYIDDNDTLYVNHP